MNGGGVFALYNDSVPSVAMVSGTCIRNNCTALLQEGREPAIKKWNEPLPWNKCCTIVLSLVNEIIITSIRTVVGERRGVK